jgi:hypothetical protein
MQVVYEGSPERWFLAVKRRIGLLETKRKPVDWSNREFG